MEQGKKMVMSNEEGKWLDLSSSIYLYVYLVKFGI